MVLKVDLAKRRRIMQRSQKLGHCVCDPRRPCPCDVFTEQGLCPCAGERPDPIDLSAVRLTELVHNAGCASKIAPADLEAVLARLPRVADPAVVSGIAAGDDAGIYRLTDELYLVQTVDVMTPCCDDPRTFGRICAANCLSDIYAMGGTPRTALSILAFPAETLDGRIMFEMLDGAMAVLAEAGVALIGGHSIKDEEIKLGFAITGVVAADRVTANDTARVGDLLVLTKPLGAGVLNFARQVGRDYGDLTAVAESMAELNRAAAEAAAEARASACTDVTGFGLFGHLINIARHSRVTVEVWAEALPAFDGAAAALADGVVPGAIERNREFVADDIEIEPGVDPAAALLGFDAQTSGGLLVCVPESRHAQLLKALGERSVLAATIGRVCKESEGRILVSKKASKKTAKVESSCCASSEPAASASPCCSPAPANEPCCPTAVPSAAASGGLSTSAASKDAFMAFMQSSAGSGRIDARTKELINFALVLMSRCGPCFDFHLNSARKLGITQEELDEAAWCAAAMGGAPVRMFYLDRLAASGKR